VAPQEVVRVRADASEAGVSHYDIMEEAERRGIAYPLDLAEAEAMLAALPRRSPRVG